LTYGDLLRASRGVGEQLSASVLGPGAVGETPIDRGVRDLVEARIAYLVPPGLQHVAVQWGIWRAGGVGVPLATSHPPPELAHVLDDAEPAAVVVHSSLADRIVPLAQERGLPVLDSDVLCSEPIFDGSAGAPSLPDVAGARRALMIYTSGTTGRAKGVVTTHVQLDAQVTSLVDAWEWSAADHILLVLPLHHVHGIINVVTCALWSGACCQMMPRFDASETWERFARGDITLFMAVPTVYVRLIQAWEAAGREDRERWSEGAGAMRLMVSGSAALPVGVFERWQQLTGHVLLERYGMTEIGMGLSNPLRGERRPGLVGRPLPGVEVRRVDDGGEVMLEPATPGELEVRGPGVFSEYWRRPEETVAAFRDGWFRTGDVAVVEDGYYRLLGRISVDIVKTRGYKVSTLQIEETLREHQTVADCAVVGVPDSELGERLCGVVVPARDTTVDVDAVIAWAGDRLAPYKVPGELRIVDDLPRNSMGKVQKRAVKDLFAPEDTR
jgi:malonyl-CoA/methylmalonyl-CoA synthetase